jgi:hypothetical protein
MTTSPAPVYTGSTGELSRNQGLSRARRPARRRRVVVESIEEAL